MANRGGRNVGHIIAIIPARSGSKSVKDKNIRIMNGKPMIAYSIEHALMCKAIDRVIVSTDSPLYKEIAEQYGAEVPFLRPVEISQDSSLDIEVFEHTLKWLKENEGYEADLCVHLRPTHPIREPSDIEAMIRLAKSSPDVDSVRSVSLAKQIPYKMWLFSENDRMTPLITCSIPEAYNAPRQKLPKVYMQNACIDVVRSSVILQKHSMSGEKILGYKMNYDFDIDTEEDFLTAEQALLLREAKIKGEHLQICCDIDGVIAMKTLGNQYNHATPMKKNIALLNRLYQAGHEIILFTARGYATGIDWEDVTKSQLSEWTVHYHKLIFGKPNADIYIDDKFMALDKLENLL